MCQKDNDQNNYKTDILVQKIALLLNNNDKNMLTAATEKIIFNYWSLSGKQCIFFLSYYKVGTLYFSY